MSTAFDKWLTTDNREDYAMDIVEMNGLVAHRDGAVILQFVGELSCEDCDTEVGWSDTGTFTEFYTDPQENHYKCEDCYKEWSAQ